ncbi:carbohydrate ABC transporter permease [Taklimakanibacter deserti]|uniref:carbohydrate ABC transporter permease n=1 Tax=Taklimakanibacter deserti TaxID=2267839 RepID=UPI000E658A45
MAEAIATNMGRAASAARSPLRRRSPFQRKAFPYLLVAPAVIYLLGITFYPGLYAIYQSLFRVRFNSWTFIGLDNYTKLLSDHEFWASLWNTFIMGSGALLLEFVIALTLAALAYRDPWIKSWRILFLLPMLFMPSAVSFIWKLAFNDGRVVSDLLMRIGMIDRPLDFLGNIWLARLSLIITDVWQWTPFLFIIFVAALQGQDAEIEEAARLDGARWSQIFWNVSLPMLRPIIAVALVLRGIDIVTMFTSIFIITGGTPGGATETMSYFIYRTGFKRFDFGYASAASVLLLALTVIIAQSFVKRFFRSGRD